MSEMGCDTGNGRSFHFEIGHLEIAETEALEGIKHVWHGKWHPEHSPLRTIETGCGNCHSRECTVPEQF